MPDQPVVAASGETAGAGERRRLVPGGRILGLDGVRALAVVAVVAFHLWPTALPGGFLGVDVFFVISGFLITTLLRRERDATDRIALGPFWIRRARRLLPALLLVVGVSIVAARLISSDLLVGIDRQTLGALTFSSNWVEIGAGADYFNHTAPVLFAPFWSLAVEEQFYVVWPLALLVILHVARRGWSRPAIPLAIGVLSALLMAVWFPPGDNPTRVYYGTDTHIFGLMLGAAMALAFAESVGVVSQPRWRAIRRWAGFVALVGLAVLTVTIDSDSTFTYRGGLVLASLLTAVLVACLPGPESGLTKVLDLPPLKWIGERSYGIYLWHWPVILLVAATRPAVVPGEPPDGTTVAIALALTLGLSAASYHWVEMPIRQHGLPGVGRILGGSAVAGWVALALLVVTSAIIVATGPDKSDAQLAVEAGQQAIEEQEAAAAAPGGGSGSSTTTPGTPAWPPGTPLPPGTSMIGFGDSVLSGVAPAVYTRFPGIMLDAVPNRQWRDAPVLVTGAIQGGTIRPVVVLQFGTNAGLQSEESQLALQETLDLLGPASRVVLVTVVGISHWVESTNATMAEIAEGRDNVAVADWYAVVAADPNLLHSDQTHPTQDGTVVYADLLAQTIEQLGPGP